MDVLVRKEEVSELLASLTERERQVIGLRYGLEDGSTHTLEEIGGILNVTRERVRQIEARAMEKLRENAKKIELPCINIVGCADSKYATIFVERETFL